LAAKARTEITVEGAAKSEKEIDRVDKATKGLTRSQRKSADATAGMGKQLNLLRAKFLAVAAAAVVVTRQFLKMRDSLLAFEKAFANVSTLIDTRTPQGVRTLANLQKQILQLNPALGSATELTEGLYQALSAGADPARAVKLVGEAALFAKAGLTSTFTAVDVLTTVLNAYGDAAGEANEISSVLFATVQQGKTTAEELARSLGLAIPNAVVLGVELTELNAAIATLTKGGLRTSIAVTAMSQVMKAFITPSGAGAEILKKMGVSAAELRDIIAEDGLVAALDLLNKATQGNIEQIGRFFESQEARIAVFALMGKQTEEFARITGELEKAQADGNVTAIAAEKIFKTMGDRAEALGNSVERFLIKELIKLEPLFISIIDAVEEFGPAAKASFRVGIVVVEIFSGVINGVIAGINTLFEIFFAGISTLLEWANKLDFVRKNLGFVQGALDFTTAAQNQFHDSATRAIDRIGELRASLSATTPELERLPPALKKAAAATEELAVATTGLTDEQKKAKEAIEEVIDGLILEATFLGRTAEEVTLLKLELMGADAAQLELARHTLEWIRANREAMAAAKAAAKALEDAAKSAAAANQKAFEQMIDNVDAFLNRVFITARSFADVWRQLMAQIVGSFVKSITRMVAEWIVGVGRMERVSAAASPGILGGLFGLARPGRAAGTVAVLAGGGGAAAGTAAAGIPGVTSTFPSSPGSIIGTVTGSGIPTATGGASSTPVGPFAFGGLGKLLTNPAVIGAGAVAGGVGLALTGNPVLGGIGGALGIAGALAIAGVVLTGFAAAATLGLSVAAGVFIASLIRGRRKNKAAGIEEDFIRQGQAVLAGFEEHRIGFNQAIGTIGQLSAQGQNVLLSSGLGRAGRRGAANLDRNLGILSQEMIRIQTIRDQTLGELARFSIPEFQMGGSVRAINAGGGRILAFLTPGEFVVNKEGVQAIGESFLGKVNAGVAPVAGVGGGQVNVTLNINAVDGASIARWWRQQEPMVVKTIKRAVRNGAL